MLEVIHSPKLEDLADQLAEQLRAQRRRQVENILQPIVVVVGNIGIGRWLERRIANRFGIFANVRFVLTGEWLNAQMARFGVVKNHDAERFSVAAMTWGLYALLETPERFGLLRDTALLERERFQLAAKLARLFSEYLIYRREWLLDFEQQAARALLRTRVPAETKEWQARLWCALSARLNGAHRAAKFHALLDAIRQQTTSGAYSDTPSYFFGLNHLPPDVLTLLEQLSESAPVKIYFPNPCVEYWADVVRERFLAQRRLGTDLLQADMDELSGFDHFDVGHPLLASLGGHGQAYFAELSHATAHFTEPDAFAVELPPLTPTLLAALQYGISYLQPDFAPETLRFDRSIQVLNAQSVVDELVQVKAIVLSALVADPNLQLDEIVIMTPTLSRYAPLLPAVFGAELCASQTIAPQFNHAAVHPGPRPQSALRYSVLDLTQASVSPLLEHLLQAPELRWEPAQLLALMGLDALTQHFGLDANDLELASRILQRAHIAFGFNNAHRQQLLAATASPNASANTAKNAKATEAAPSSSLHTWEAGLERLLFGYLHGNQAEFEQVKSNQSFPEPLWPVPDIDVRHANVLSAILQLIRALRLFIADSQRARTLPQWTQWLERQIFSFTGEAAPETVCAIFTQLKLDAEHAQLTEEVSFIAIREAITAQLAQVSRRETPALGAICVCGFVPMRALPFKVVCILGLNEAEFPKPEMPDSLNLMRATGARRPGDRSRAQEDRYLFLEAIMAARRLLVLSYQGLSSEGKPRLPCGVLAELLAQLRRQVGALAGSTPWLVAAEPSNPAAFNAPVFMAATALPEKAGNVQHTNQQTVLSVTDLMKFWQKPLPTYVQQRLRVATKQSDDGQTPAEQNSEPLSLSTSPLERIEARLLTHALAVGRFPQTAPAWLGRSGYLASGALGVQSYESIAQDSRAGWRSIKGKFPDFIKAPKQPVRLDLDLGSTRLVGYIPGVYLAQRACVCVSNKALHGAHRLRLLLQVLMLRAAETDPNSKLPPWRALYLGPDAKELEIHASPEEARDYLANLIALRGNYLQNNQPRDVADHSAAPPWFWPKLSYTAFSAKGDPHAAVTGVIEAGKDYELTDSGLKFFLPNASFFDADRAEFAQFLELAQTVFAPFAPPKEPEVPPQKHVPSVLSTDPPPRSFAVTKRPLPEPNSPAEISLNTLNLEQFGHDDSADFDDAY